ncbi:MAG: winged helix-turn-helix transcriptional regulator [Candidatus Micrarchaeota archaeon]|nr:winged helix-turn-helix transcriptional regulator [Candidatus Micrarchaeota archaeon]MDE1848048.1 winged helix-turn-helix transcriptional regulator [Candidatus Micrarchaeota archaeon]MDE1864721.1 winged helix-turn-helix transcriptional regulator [Candidatus Micrarchaeota archaeon]
MKNLDIKDRKILYALDMDARQSDSEIAKKVRLSREAVRYRIAKLVENGYINYFMTTLNSMKLGFDWYRTFFKFQNLSVEKEGEIISWLFGRVSWITKAEGKWDLNTGKFTKTVYEYRDFINEFLLKYGEYIEAYNVAVVTRMWHYHRDYLLGKKEKSLKYELMGFEEGTKYESQKIDKTDYKILSVLLKNARMKTVDIADRIGSTEMVVRYRIKKMRENGIILGFKPFLNMKKLEYMYFKVHFTLHNLTPQKKEGIMQYVHQHPNTVHTTELVGGDDLETEFQVKSNEEFFEHIRDMRIRYGEIIREYFFMQYTDESKFSYLPEMEFKG